jgi:hypothetical protein
MLKRAQQALLQPGYPLKALCSAPPGGLHPEAANAAGGCFPCDAGGAGGVDAAAARGGRQLAQRSSTDRHRAERAGGTGYRPAHRHRLEQGGRTPAKICAVSWMRTGRRRAGLHTTVRISCLQVDLCADPELVRRVAAGRKATVCISALTGAF